VGGKQAVGGSLAEGGRLQRGHHREEEAVGSQGVGGQGTPPQARHRAEGIGGVERGRVEGLDREKGRGRGSAEEGGRIGGGTGQWGGRPAAAAAGEGTGRVVEEGKLGRGAEVVGVALAAAAGAEVDRGEVVDAVAVAAEVAEVVVGKGDSQS
jgi:hypothetical protein